MYKLFKTILLTEFEPQNTDVLWLRPVENGFALYYHIFGKWEPLRIMNTKGTATPFDDVPYDLDGQSTTPGPDTVGTEQIIDNSVIMDDLNDSVKEKIQKTYHHGDESLHMDYDIVDGENDD